MEMRTMGDVGVAVRELRRRRGWTQAQLAERVGVSRAWVVRLEGGSPRLEAQLVLDAFVALGGSLMLVEPAASAPEADDPFAIVFDRLTP